MFETLEIFLNAGQGFVLAFNAWCAKVKPAALADHLCYKCGDAVKFETLRTLFESQSQFVYQSIISNRRIAIIKFLKPIPTDLGDIWFLELSDQKPDNSQTSGFDHIEIYPIGGSLDMLAESLAKAGTPFTKVERPHHTTFDVEINGPFKVRLEEEPLIEKIMREEMQ